jgi:ABC-2 type transport system permease protein
MVADALACLPKPRRRQAYRLTRSNLVLTGPMERLSLERFQNPLPLDESILVGWPYLALLAALTLVCFGLSYVVFMRHEIRSV